MLSFPYAAVFDLGGPVCQLPGTAKNTELSLGMGAELHEKCVEGPSSHSLLASDNIK